MGGPEINGLQKSGFCTSLYLLLQLSLLRTSITMAVADELLWLFLLTLHGGAIPGTCRKTGDPGVGPWGCQFWGGCVCVNTNQHSAPETGKK